MRIYNPFVADGIYAMMSSRGTSRRSHKHLLLIQEAGIPLENLEKPVVITRKGSSFSIDDRK